MKKISNVYICVTPCHLYLSLLLINDKKDNAYILLNANDKEIYKQFNVVASKMRNAGYLVDTRLRNKKKDILGLEAGVSRKQFEKVFGDEKEPIFALYNFAWNCQYVYSTADLFYKKCNTAFFIEEGALTPINPPQPSWKVVLKRITGAPVDFYKDEKVKGIYVQKPEMYPKDWGKKLKSLNVKIMLNELANNEKKTIIDVFIGDLIESLGEMQKDIGIIYTQPLSEDGYISEETKKEYFQNMVDFYGEGKPVFLKIHPRDLSEYRVPANCTVLPGYFPSELMNILAVRFKFAVGICTSAVSNADADIKMNINENFLNDKEFALKPLE